MSNMQNVFAVNDGRQDKNVWSCLINWLLTSNQKVNITIWRKKNEWINEANKQKMQKKAAQSKVYYV